jgi:molybdate transport system ATP-binding protein
MTALQAILKGRVGTLCIDVTLETGGGTLALIGPNGAGKSTLLFMLLGIRQPQTGRVVVDGSTLFDTSTGVDIAVEDRRLGYVPQSYALFPHMNVLENVEFAVACGTGDRNRHFRRTQAEAILNEFGLTELSARRSTDLSGGEKQKVALARTLAAKPQALLLDEPLAALDALSRRGVRSYLGAYLKKVKLPSIVVTHDPEDASALGDCIAVLEAGRMAQIGTWQDLRQRPASAFVKQFVERSVS